jgi:RNA polymerase sigma-70 factor (ECF subfamily)
MTTDPRAIIDPDTLSRAQRGEPDAIERLLAGLAPTLHRFARRLCGDGPDVDDAVQDSLLLIARKVGEFEGRSSLTSWSYAVARSACSHRRRGLKNRPPVEDEHAEQRPSEDKSPESMASDAELSRAVREVLERLPEDYREVLVLRDIEGLTAPEAAEAVGLSVDALKSRLHRARGALRKALAPWLESESGAQKGEGTTGVLCPDAADMLSRKIEGELTTADCAAMEKHVEQCSRCKGACNALTRALGSCARIGSDGSDTPVPATLQEDVRRAFKRWLAAAPA